MESPAGQGAGFEGRPTGGVSTRRAGVAWAGLRADVFVFHEFPAVSRTRLRQKIQGGEALLNGHRFSTSTRLRAGDEVRVTWRGTPPAEEAAHLRILHEDEHLLIVDKPAGIATHPMGRRQAGTVVQVARRKLQDRVRAALERGDPAVYPTVVNRLDVHTSGIVILALTRGAHRAMQALTASREVHREYLALVEGRVRDNEGLIDLPIGLDPVSSVRLKMAVRPDGKASRTRWEVVERLPAHTVLRVYPQTGRQHQIRVHLAAIGHPVAGDLLYKDESRFLAAQQRQPGGAEAPHGGRHGLHARRAVFIHPASGERVEVVAAVPADLAAMIESARAAHG